MVQKRIPGNLRRSVVSTVCAAVCFAVAGSILLVGATVTDDTVPVGALVLRTGTPLSVSHALPPDSHVDGHS
jgi:hypothetical protein